MKISESDRSKRDKITVKTQNDTKKLDEPYKWWQAGSKKDLGEQLLSTANYLKQNQLYRFRQMGIFARLYGNLPLFNMVGSGMQKANMANNLPTDRPTMNVVQSCIDTLVSRISQSRPRPVFLTDNGNYKERRLGKQLNQFTLGEFYRNKAYELGSLVLRDAAVTGTGCIKIVKDNDNKVKLERVLNAELFVDQNEAAYGEPRQLYQFKLIDRDVLANYFPEYKSTVQKAEAGYLDNSAEVSRSVSDQIIVVEAWHLPSGENAGDGRHTIVCSAGVIFDEEYKKNDFPFVFLHYSPRLMGFWGQGLSEQLMGTQIEINKLLMTIASAINLTGVPRVFLEEGSKVVKAHLNNSVGSIITYRGVKPIYEVAPCMPQEVYAQLQRLINYAYQQSGISALAASSQKPAGLTSGAALREYDDIQADRFASLVKRYDQMFIDCSYKIIDAAKEIAEETGSYQAIYPDKNKVEKIDLPNIELLKNPFVIQCYDASSLPKDPSGRLQKVVEMMQAQLISPQEGRRLLDYPDIEQVDKLANAAEERIYQILDKIIDDGIYTPPDEFMNLEQASEISQQYYNVYAMTDLEPEKKLLIMSFYQQSQSMVQMTQAAIAAQAAQAQPQMAVPEQLPTSEMLANVR
jgi:hypothetical protein